MEIVHVEKDGNFTFMRNIHLRDRFITLKAKGLLSLMFSLPPEWDCTINGLAYISKEGISAIRATMRELEEAGYVTRERNRNEAGQLKDMKYTIHETPKDRDPKEPPKGSSSGKEPSSTGPASGNPVFGQPALEKPMLENPTLDSPEQVSPALANPAEDNRTQFNTNRPNTQKSKRDIKSLTHQALNHQISINQAQPSRHKVHGSGSLGHVERPL